jgi:hypothetical protein
MTDAPKLNLLLSFPYLKPSIVRNLLPLVPFSRILLDSGAFTAFRAGKTINVDDYCRFIEDLPFKPWRYFNLDVIGDGPASERNYQIMRERGLSPVPIFTRGSPLDQLDRMFETSPDLVGVGGLVVAHNPPYRYLKAVMRYVAGRPVHLLGFTHPSWLQYLKPYSCDASSFTRSTRFGYNDVYLGDGKFYHMLRNTAATAQPPEAAMRAIAGYGFDPYELQQWQHWSKQDGLGRYISTVSWMHYAADMERHGGTLVFLATGGADLARMDVCYRAITEGLNLAEACRASLGAKAA